MSAAKHTPGPWTAVYVGCSDWDLKGPVTGSDWKLAAAAPELLEMLTGCLEHMEHSTPQGRAAYEAARAAIAKATGEAA